MRGFRSFCILAGLIGVAGAAHGQDVLPMQATNINLVDFKGIAYYTVEKEGLRIVATVAQGEAGTPIRFVATLLPGQRTVLSVPGAVGQVEQAVELLRVDDRVSISPATAATDPKSADNLAVAGNSGN
jgi:hypothetical protein